MAGNLPKTLVQQISSTPLDTSLIKSTLRSYQTFGVKYIIHQMKSLIGDEMGLGKTVEAAAAMAHLSAKGETHFVVVCPLSVLVNWTREIPIHTKLHATSIHGPKRDASFRTWCRRGGVAVTTYETVSRLDWTQLGTATIGIVVVDEAHYIKNPKAKRTVIVHRLLMDDTVDKHVQEILAKKRQVFEDYADVSHVGQESLEAIDTGAILNIIEEERKRYGVKGGNTKASTRSSAGDES